MTLHYSTLQHSTLHYIHNAHTYIHTYIHTYLPTYIHADRTVMSKNWREKMACNIRWDVVTIVKKHFTNLWLKTIFRSGNGPIRGINSPECFLGNVPSATTAESLIWSTIRCYIESPFPTWQDRNATTWVEVRYYIRCPFELLLLLLLPFRCCWFSCPVTRILPEMSHLADKMWGCGQS